MANKTSKKVNYLSIASVGLKRKLIISFCLMSILPILVTIYVISNYVLSRAGFKLDIAASILISILIASIGFFVIKEIIDRVLSVATDAKLIASGDINRKIFIDRVDEVGELGDSLNQLTQRIRGYMDELKNYGLKTTEINFEIQRRILVLSSLLQITSLISQCVKLDEILKLATGKSRLLADSDVAYLLFKEEGQEEFSARVSDGLNSQYLLAIKLDPAKSIFTKLVKTNKPLVLDKDNILPENLTLEFSDKFKLKNTLALPIYLRGIVMGILGIGNTREDFVYKKDDVELLDIFAKQIAIAIENDFLVHQVEKLEIKDALTGLYNKTYITNRLQEEIKRAVVCQRPCSFVLVNIDDFQKFKANFGSLQAESILRKIGSLIRESVSEIDRVARFDDNEFAIVLPEKNKRQAHEVSDEIRKKIEFVFTQEQQPQRKLTLSGGVSENPLDGVLADELISKAKELLSAAKKQGKNRIISFTGKAI